MPQWARDTLAAHLEREAFTRLEIAKELRKCNPPKPTEIPTMILPKSGA